MFLGHVVSNIPSDILSLRSICDEFNIMICSQALKDDRTPIVKVTVCSFWAPSSISVYPIIVCQGKRRSPLANELAAHQFDTTLSTLMNLDGSCDPFLRIVSILFIIG